MAARSVTGLLAGVMACGLGWPAGGWAEDLTVHENQGRVCFETTADGAVSASYMIFGCFSSSCTTVPETRLIATVTENPATIRLDARIVTGSTGDLICTTDCGGVPAVPFVLGVLPVLDYQVTIGDGEVGMFRPAPGGESACLP